MKSILLTGGQVSLEQINNSLKINLKFMFLKRKSNKKLSIDNHKNIFLINYQNINEIENLIYKK